YENKYVKFFRSKPELPPGLNPEPSPTPARGTPGCDPPAPPGLSKAARRNLKRKEKRKQEKERESDEGLRGGGGGGGTAGQKTAEKNGEKRNPGNCAEGAERSRRIKSLRKKLRQVEELRLRLEAGGVPAPTREQLEKLGRRRALEEELRGLELDS
ncbi:PYM1 protein, partial [Pomatostomus ruficeps]|nr:PYM1 protein [Pomatostomus ruficeps]